MSYDGKPWGFMLALSSAALFAVSIVRPAWYFLIWVAFIPLLLAARGVRGGRGFLLGLLMGTFAAAGGYAWAWDSIARFLPLSPVPAMLLFLVFIGWQGLQFAIFTSLLCAFATSGLSLIFPSLLWVVLEQYYPAFFPWQLGNLLRPHLPFLQLATLTGGVGLSFAIMSVNSCLSHGYVQRQRGKPWWPACLAASAILLSLEAYGRWSLRQVEHEQADRSLTIAVAQGNRPAIHQQDETFLQESLQVYTQLSRDIVATAQPAMIIWPEVAVPTRLPLHDAALRMLFTVAAQTQAILLVGALTPATDGKDINSAFLISPTGDIFGSYQKSQLLPFAEHLPWLFHWLDGWWPTAGFTPGVPSPPLLLPGTRFALAICYEATVPGFFRQAVKDGAEFLVNLTNDAWLGDTSGPEQHLQAAVMRAVESRRWLMRASNSGVSAFIAPSGRIVKHSALFTSATLQHTIDLRREDTFYIRWGDWFVYVCLSGVMLCFLSAMASKRPLHHLSERYGTGEI